jgi:hypothetical protein
MISAKNDLALRVAQHESHAAHDLDVSEIRHLDPLECASTDRNGRGGLVYSSPWSAAGLGAS